MLAATLRSVIVMIVLVVFGLSSCVSSQEQPRGNSLTEMLRSVGGEKSRRTTRNSSSNSAIISDSGSNASAYQTEVRGSGRFIGSVEQLSDAQTADGRDGVVLNFRNAPVEEVAKAILGDMLGLNYVVSSKVKNNVTVQTTSPIPKAKIAQIFESALAANGYAITVANNIYQIVPASDVPGSRIATLIGDNPKIGQGTRIVPLQNVSATKMVELLEPVSKPGAVLLANDDRDVLILSGNSRELDLMNDMVKLFDVDKMKGMSFAFYPVEVSDPQVIVRELDSIFSVDKSAKHPRIQFIPNKRLGAILVISKNPRKFDEAAAWIRRLDNAGKRNEKGLFVYKIQNRPAAELARVLQQVLKGGVEPGTGGSNNVAPRYPTESVSARPEVEGGNGLSDIGTNSSGGNGSNGNNSTSFKTDGATVVADIANNALLIHSSRKEYERILKIARRLDVLPTQVMLEAMIVEVSLNDDLRFGLKWFFEKNGSSFTFTDAISGAVESVFPGFSYLFQAADVRAVIDALSEVTKVNVVSAPSLMVLDNRSATLQIGDQVPIVTRTGKSIDDPDSPIVSNVEMKDTGVIFHVTPRVNDSGRVVLEIEQEVSNVIATTSSGIDSPTIQQRRIQTTVVVSDGEVITLGGLIQQRDSLSKKQLPVLGNIPVLGTLFRQKKTTIARTELLVFIRPIVVRDEFEAMAVTDEFIDRLSITGLEATRGDQHYVRDLRRIFK